MHGIQRQLCFLGEGAIPLTPDASPAGMVQGELCQRQEHDARVRRESSAQGHLCEGNLLSCCVSLFLLFGLQTDFFCMMSLEQENVVVQASWIIT